MSLARQLWHENNDIVQETLAHPFVQGLGDGTLPRAMFQSYIAQDAYFLESFSRAYALGLARSPDREGMNTFFQLLSGVQEELRLHEGYAERWGVSLHNVTPHLATSAYTNFLLATASLQTMGELCAAMTPCMRLYAFLGQSLAKIQNKTHDYSEWIQTYADPEFENLARRLEVLLDHYAIDTPGLHQAYRHAMQLELRFFAAQYA